LLVEQFALEGGEQTLGQGVDAPIAVKSRFGVLPTLLGTGA